MGKGVPRGRRLEFLGPAKAPRPTTTVPGSAERIAILAARVAAREAVFSDQDGCQDGEGLRIECGRNGKPLVVGVEGRIAEKQMRLTAVNLKKFSQRLIFLRFRRGLLANELARKAGVEKAALYRLELGLYEPKFATAVALARALEVPVSILAGELVEQL